MIKNNSKGFVLAETLVVAVFLMAIFTLIFTNFYPLMGEYEKRESYDDVEGKYAVYWIRRMIEDSSYQLSSNHDSFFTNNGYVRFECQDITDSGKRDMCKNLLKSLEVSSCDSDGNNCEIYITKYQIGSTSSGNWFKNKVEENSLKRFQVNNNSESNYITNCKKNIKTGDDAEKTETCTKEANKKEFRSGFNDYLESLPDYKVESLDDSAYRVIAAFHHKKDNNNYYSYATMEVDR